MPKPEDTTVHSSIAAGGMPAMFRAAMHGHEGWPEFDASLLDDRRGPVPAFPLDLLPLPWRGWVADTARAAAAPPDYVAQSVLAATAGLCIGANVRVAPGWSEPLTLCQVLVGGAASGKSSAIAPVRRLLVAAEAGAPAEAAKPLLLWRDESRAWLADLAPQALDAWNDEPQPSIVGTFRPEALEEALREADIGLAGGLLYAWPGLPPYCPLAERRRPDDDQVLRLMRRLHGAACRRDDPPVLVLDEAGGKAFDAFLARLHPERARAEGLEAAWLGRGPGTVARLAGVLEVLAWSGAGASGRPGPIGRERMAAAIDLWSGYFRPHARAVFDRWAPTDLERRARRVARWLKDGGATEVSREDVRREALGQAVKASEADLVIYRLSGAGILRLADAGQPRRGPRARRWEVNPVLREG